VLRDHIEKEEARLRHEHDARFGTSKMKRPPPNNGFYPAQTEGGRVRKGPRTFSVE